MKPLATSLGYIEPRLSIRKSIYFVSEDYSIDPLLSLIVNRQKQENLIFLHLS